MAAHDVGTTFLDTLGATLRPALPGTGWVLAGVVLGALLVATPAWTLARPFVTVVHELGHAVVGLLCGRRFTGFVVAADMSGHTLTRGRTRGGGIVATTAAGYPAPAVVGALMVWAGSQGWSRSVMLAACVAFLVALVRSRSALTVLVLTVLVLGAAFLWWADVPDARAVLVVALGVVLLVGAWRQWIAVARSADPSQDPAVLRRLSGIPMVVWHALFLLAIGASTVWAVLTLWPILVRTVGASSAPS